MEADETALLFNLDNRVRNVGLPPSQFNSLIPLFEAISNSIHAIDERFGEAASREGKIYVRVERLTGEADRNVIGFRVEDNGIGLDSRNWLSFRTSDHQKR